jgi:hypothetical protein
LQESIFHQYQQRNHEEEGKDEGDPHTHSLSYYVGPGFCVFSSFSFCLCVPYATCTIVNKIFLYLGYLFQPLPPENEAQDAEPATSSTAKEQLNYCKLAAWGTQKLTD